MKMRAFCFAAAAAAMAFALPSSAGAATISIGLSQVGFDPDGGGGIPVGGIQTVATGLGSADFAGAFGNFNVNVASGSAFPDLFLPSLFETASRNVVGTNTGGTLSVYITASGLLDPDGLVNFITTLTSNTLSGGATTTLSAYLDTGDGIFSTSCATCTLLASAPFAAPGALTIGSFQDVGPDDGFSLTAVYTIIAGPGGSANSTINVAVPGPLVGAGLPGLIIACGALVLLGRRRRQQLA